MRTLLCFRWVLAAVFLALFARLAEGQAYEVSLRVEIQPGQTATSPDHSKAMKGMNGTSPVVGWLTPIGTAELRSPRPATSSHSFVLTQKEKQFTPHLLVVPTGSAVEFPNLDPFFHNVFSLFNGRRFDLGLYEAGERRTVRFDHEGVSYIFCNIHPEMGAVIVSLSTPFFAVSAKDGTLTLPGVPPGDYRLHLWAENIAAADLASASQTVHLSTQNVHLPTLTFRESIAPLKRHLNKFGEEYKKSDQNPY